MEAQIEAIIFRINESEEIEYLLLKRIGSRQGFWQPVTGGVKKSEKLLDAVHREVFEETGIRNLKRIIKEVHRFKLKENGVEEFVFGVEVSISEKIDLRNNVYPEHEEYKWCNLEEARELLKWPENKVGLKKLNEILSID